MRRREYTDEEIRENLEYLGNCEYDKIFIPLRILKSHEDFKKFDNRGRLKEYQKTDRYKEWVRNYMREYQKRPERIEWRRRYYQRPEVKEKFKKYLKKWQNKNRNKVRTYEREYYYRKKQIKDKQK